MSSDGANIITRLHVLQLEERLRTVTTDANVLATDFMSAREQLSNENAYLSARLAELTNISQDRTATITALAQEQLRLDKQGDDMRRRLREVGDLIQIMGGQRAKLCGKVHQWEDGLMVAGREGWRAMPPATPSADTTFSFGSQRRRQVSEGDDDDDDDITEVAGVKRAVSQDDEEENAMVITASDSDEAVFGTAGSF